MIFLKCFSKILFVIGLGFIILGGTDVLGQTSADDPWRPYRSPFRYVIVESKSRYVKELKIRHRYVALLVEEKAFTPENLEPILRLVLKRFPAPDSLQIEVFTYLGDLETPEERDLPKFSESNAPYKVKNFAFLVRSKGSSFFTMIFADDDKKDVTVYLKKNTK